MLYEANGIKKFVVVCGYTDLRKSSDDLSEIICNSYQLDPFERNQGTLVGRKRLPAPLQALRERIVLLATDTG